MRLRSRTEHNLDVKGRLSLPKRFVEVIKAYESQELVIASFKNHVRLYPLAQWEKFEEKILAGAGDQALASWMRYVVAGSVFTNLDKQGRILIPAYFREEASLRKSIVLHGMLDWMEVWDAAVWKKEQQSIRDNFENFNDSLQNLGII